MKYPTEAIRQFLKYFKVPKTVWLNHGTCVDTGMDIWDTDPWEYWSIDRCKREEEAFFVMANSNMPGTSI